MGELQLKSRVRIKKYRAYKGEEGQVAPNLLKRKFDTKRPNQKWVTDVTKFRVGGQKPYLSQLTFTTVKSSPSRPPGARCSTWSVRCYGKFLSGCDRAMARPA